MRAPKHVRDTEFATRNEIEKNENKQHDSEIPRPIQRDDAPDASFYPKSTDASTGGQTGWTSDGHGRYTRMAYEVVLESEPPTGLVKCDHIEQAKQGEVVQNH